MAPPAGTAGDPQTPAPRHTRAVDAGPPAVVVVGAVADRRPPPSLYVDRWWTAVSLALVALVAYLIAPQEQPPAYGLDHETTVNSAAFLPSVVGLTGRPMIDGNRVRLLNNGDAFYPAMLSAVREAAASVTIEAYIYWEGRIGMEFAVALADRARNGVSVKILLDAVGSSTIGTEILQVLEVGRLRAGVVQPDSPLVARALQLPHPSQDPRHRRPAGLHRWRGHRRSLGRPRRGSGALARHADRDRRPGHRAAADRVRAELAADDPRTGQWPALLPADSDGGRRRHPRHAQLALRRRLGRAHHLLLRDHLRA